MTFILVRHAHAGERRRWEGDDRLRPLSEKGLRQSDALVAVVRDLEPKRILTSPAVRCRQTVEPLGRALGLDVIDDDRLFEGSGTPEVTSLADDADETTTVLCSHGDVIPRILDTLLDRGLSHEGSMKWQKASTWILPYSVESGWGWAEYRPPPAR